MAYVKLDCGILDSTLWLDFDTRNVFITALLMAEPREFKEPVVAFDVASTKPSGFIVPPGWYGLVSAAAPGILYRAMVALEVGIKSLEALANPDPMSRSKDFDGRRMVPVDGGFVVLNYDKYREKDHTSKERSRRYRERKQAAAEAVAVRVTAEDMDVIIDSFKKSWTEKFQHVAFRFGSVLRKHLPNLTPADIELIKDAFDAHVHKLEETKYFNPEKFCATWRANLEGGAA